MLTEEKGNCGARIPRKGSAWQRPNLSSQGQNFGLKNHGSSPSPRLSPILDSSPPFEPSLAQGLSPSQGFKTKMTLDGQRKKRPSLVGLEEGQGGERLQESKPMQHT